MAQVFLFNVNVWAGDTGPPVVGEVLVQDKKIFATNQNEANISAQTEADAANADLEDPHAPADLQISVVRLQ